MNDTRPPHLPACCMDSGNDAGCCPTDASTTGGMRGGRGGPPRAAARASSAARPPAAPPLRRGIAPPVSASFTAAPNASGAIFSSCAACSGVVDQTTLLYPFLHHAVCCVLCGFARVSPSVTAQGSSGPAAAFHASTGVPRR